MGALSHIENSVFRLGLLAILGVCLHQSGQARVSEGGQRCSYRMRRACFVYFQVRLLINHCFATISVIRLRRACSANRTCHYSERPIRFIFSVSNNGVARPGGECTSALSSLNSPCAEGHGSRKCYNRYCRNEAICYRRKRPYEGQEVSQ